MGNAPYKVFKGEQDDMPLDINKGFKYKNPSRDEESLTGWDRVIRLFEKDGQGGISPELERCIDTVVLTAVAGALIGGVGRSRLAYMNFFRSNQHTAFETPLQARTKLQEALFIGFGSGAYRIAWRVAAFSAIYSVSSACFTEYRGKPSFMDPAFGGATAGFLYKFREGPKLSLAGMIVGGALGMVGGTVTKGALTIFGISPDELIAQNRQIIYERRQAELATIQSVRPPEVSKITLDQFHAEMLNETDKEPEEESASQSNKSSTLIKVATSNTSSPTIPVKPNHV